MKLSSLFFAEPTAHSEASTLKLSIDPETLLSQLSSAGGRRLGMQIVLGRYYFASFLKLLLLACLVVISSVATPLALKLFIQNLSQTGLVFTPILFLTSFANVFFTHHFFYRCGLMELYLSASLRSVIHLKLLRLNRQSRQKFSAGYMLSLYEGSNYRGFGFYSALAHAILYTGQVLLVLYLLWQLVGAAILYGSAVLVGLLLITTRLADRQAKKHEERTSAIEARLGLMQELLRYYKAIKMHAWELLCNARIDSVRQRESAINRSLTILGSVSTLLSTSALILTAAAIFSYRASMQQSLAPDIVFPTLLLLAILTSSFKELPSALSGVFENDVYLRRLGAFMSEDESSPNRNGNGKIGELNLNQTRFCWEPSVATVDIHNLKVNNGELIAVVGNVASGKSTLLFGLIGELAAQFETSFSYGGRIAYISAYPWLFNASLRENIILDKPLDEEAFNRVLEHAQLSADLARLPHRELTIVGDRGCMLSHGQRQRVALARALYQGGDIFIFDDCLSMLDAEVARDIYDHCIVGALNDKTRILVAGKAEYTQNADQIIYLEAGKPALIETDPNRSNAKIDLIKNDKSEHRPLPAIEAEPAEIDSNAVGNPSLAYLTHLIPHSVLGIFVAILFARQISSICADLWVGFYGKALELNPHYFLVGYALLIAATLILTFLRASFVLFRGLAAGIALHKRQLKGILSTSLSFFEKTPAGRIIARFSHEQEIIDRLLPLTARNLFAHAIDIVTVVLCVSLLQPVTLLLFIPIAYVYRSLVRRFRERARMVHKRGLEGEASLLARFNEAIEGTDTIRAFNQSTYFIDQYKHLANSYCRAESDIIYLNRHIGFRLELLGCLIMLCASYSAALAANSSYNLVIGSLVVVYAQSMMNAMNLFVRSLIHAETLLTSVARIEEFAQLPEEPQGSFTPPPHWPTEGSIRFNDFSAYYNSMDSPALSSVNCEIAAQSRAAIIGRTGAGKSTFALSLLRLMPRTTGTITIDGIDIAQVAHEKLRTAFTVIPQEPVLLAGTIRENIDVHNKFSESEIWSVLEQAQVAGRIRSLPTGLDSVIQSAGLGFSSGERYLLCLARALLNKRKIILMDEATATLDAHTNSIVQQAIQKNFSDVTMIVITHQLETICEFDSILTIENGILEQDRYSYETRGINPRVSS